MPLAIRASSAARPAAQAAQAAPAVAAAPKKAAVAAVAAAVLVRFCFLQLALGVPFACRPRAGTLRFPAASLVAPFERA